MPLPYQLQAVAPGSLRDLRNPSLFHAANVAALKLVSIINDCGKRCAEPDICVWLTGLAAELGKGIGVIRGSQIRAKASDL